MADSKEPKDSKRVGFVVPPVAIKSASSKVTAYHFGLKGEPVIEDFDLSDETPQIAFQGVPYLFSSKYIAKGSMFDVTHPHVQLFLIQAARIPSPENPVIYLWYGSKGISSQSVDCNLVIEEIDEKDRKWNVKAKCVVDHTGGKIIDLKIDGTKYVDIKLPLSISGNIVLSQ